MVGIVNFCFNFYFIRSKSGPIFRSRRQFVHGSSVRPFSLIPAWIRRINYYHSEGFVLLRPTYYVLMLNGTVRRILNPSENYDRTTSQEKRANLPCLAMRQTKGIHPAPRPTNDPSVREVECQVQQVRQALTRHPSELPMVRASPSIEPQRIDRVHLPRQGASRGLCRQAKRMGGLNGQASRIPRHQGGCALVPSRAVRLLDLP